MSEKNDNLPDEENSIKNSSESKYKKLFTNTMVLGMGTFASKLLVFFLVPLYTSILSSAEYGIADIITQTSNLIIPIASVGIYNGVFRFAADKAEDKKTIFSSAFFTLIIGLLIFTCISPLFRLIDYLSSYAWLLCAYVVAAGIHYVCSYYLRAIDKTKLFAVQGIFNTLLTILLNLLFLIGFRIGIVGYVLSVVISNVITTVVIFISSGIWKDLSIRAVSKTKIAELLKYSIPLIPTTVFWWITDVSDRYIVTHFCGNAANGIYSVSYKIPTLLTLISGVFIEAWQFSAISENKDEKELGKFYSKVFEAFMGVSFIACALLILSSRLASGILFADSYYEAWRYIPTLLTATVFTNLVSFLGTVYMVKKKSVLAFATSIIGALINIVLNFILIPEYGPLGAAFATFICYFTVFLIRMINALKYIKFKMFLLRLSVNSVLVVTASCLMTFEVKYYIPLISAIVLVVTSINIKPIISMAKMFIHSFSHKKKMTVN